MQRNEGNRDTPEAQLSVLEFLVVLVRHGKLVFGMPLIVAVIAGVIALALPNTYTATARILPPQQGVSPTAMAFMGDLLTAGPGGAISQALGLKNPSDLYVGMLKSRSIADALVKRFRLQEIYGEDTLVDTRKALLDATNFVITKDGIIAVEVDDYDPKRAADLANAYVEELDRLTQHVTVSTAGRQRIFLEKQLKQFKEQLVEAEVALQATQKRTGIISVSEQGKAMIESVAGLRALVAAKQVELAAMRTSATETNPAYVRAKEELTGLRSELAKLERSNPSDGSIVIPSAGTIPEAGLEYVRKYRDVQYYQTLFELLAKQYEIARSQEAAEGGLIQVLDNAVMPDKKSKPHRSLIVFASALIAFVFAIALAFLEDARQRTLSNPAQARLWEELKQYLRSFKPRA